VALSDSYTEADMVRLRAKIGSAILQGSLLEPKDLGKVARSKPFVSKQMNKMLVNVVSDDDADDGSGDEFDGMGDEGNDSDEDHFDGHQKELAMDLAKKKFAAGKTFNIRLLNEKEDAIAQAHLIQMRQPWHNDEDHDIARKVVLSSVLKWISKSERGSKSDSSMILYMAKVVEEAIYSLASDIQCHGMCEEAQLITRMMKFRGLSKSHPVALFLDYHRYLSLSTLSEESEADAEFVGHGSSQPFEVAEEFEVEVTKEVEVEVAEVEVTKEVEAEVEAEVAEVEVTKEVEVEVAEVEVTKEVEVQVAEVEVTKEVEAEVAEVEVTKEVEVEAAEKEVTKEVEAEVAEVEAEVTIKKDAKVEKSKKRKGSKEKKDVIKKENDDDEEDLMEIQNALDKKRKKGKKK
jgi:hypothetical protein